MSTLGRKTVQKLLRRLGKDATKDMDKFLKKAKKVLKDKEDVSKRELIDSGLDAVISLGNFALALQDYRMELDEAWDEYFDKLKRAVKDLSDQKTEKSNEKKKEGKTGYIH